MKLSRKKRLLSGTTDERLFAFNALVTFADIRLRECFARRERADTTKLPPQTHLRRRTEITLHPDTDAITCLVRYDLTSYDDEYEKGGKDATMPLVVSAIYELLFLVQPDAELGSDDITLYMGNYCPHLAYPYWRMFVTSTVVSLGYPRLFPPPSDTLEHKHVDDLLHRGTNKSSTTKKRRRRKKKITKSR